MFVWLYDCSTWNGDQSTDRPSVEPCSWITLNLVMNRSRCNNHAMAASASLYGARIAQQQEQQQQQQQQQQSQHPAQSPLAFSAFTSTAKLPIEVVKQLIAAVARRPNLWIRHHSGQKRYDINQLWQEVSQETQLTADVCRVKWGHLRDNFRKVFIRNTLSDENPTTWRFYNDMRFMEKSVAENIMRQNRFKDQTRYWPELQQTQHQILHPMIPICTLKENEKQNAELGQNFDADSAEPNSKRIKLEPFDCYDNGQHEKKSSHNYIHSEDAEPEPDDDDFDEDTATEENDNLPAKNKNHCGKNIMYPIEVYGDDDEENTADNQKDRNKHRSIYNGFSETVSSMDDHSNNFSTINIKKTESLSAYAEEQDSDRMFLLSLLPYLRNIDVSRKLRVRQKLQSVLIDELP